MGQSSKFTSQMQGEADSMLEQLLERGTDDWVSAAELVSIAVENGIKLPEDQVAVALGLMVRVIVAELMTPGEVTVDGFVEWKSTPWESVTRITVDWLSRPERELLPGEIVWLCVTPRGEHLAMRSRDSQDP